MLSHRCVIANILQLAVHERQTRRELGVETQTVLGLLPFSHIYGLTVIALQSQYRGDGVIVLPRFELTSYLESVARYRIEELFVVPPIVVQMLSHKDQCNKYDLSSVRFVYCGAAPLGIEAVEDLLKWFPKWHIGQSYGT
jgi:acyl-CoA synthetase (AMP-forming)/AMP-acid ligase II